MVSLGPADPGDHLAISAYVARSQRDATRHVAYVGVEADSILEEFSRADRWSDRMLVVRDGDHIAGVLLADIDEDMGRVWWVGPWADSIDIARELLDDGRVRFGRLFGEEEMAPDSRNGMIRSLAAERDFTEGTASSVLSKTGLDPTGQPSSRRITDTTAEAVAALHDRLFPGTHTVGTTLVTAERTHIRTADVDGRTAGYIAFEAQPDGAGYVDFVGVEPAQRRRGVGRALVVDACRELAAGGATAVHLTVRADAPGAVDLYRSAGFVEERIIVPCRRGFTLD
jgi:GNAT superfamily N-acetyltransferase